MQDVDNFVTAFDDVRKRIQSLSNKAEQLRLTVNGDNYENDMDLLNDVEQAYQSILNDVSSTFKPIRAAKRFSHRLTSGSQVRS